MKKQAGTPTAAKSSPGQRPQRATWYRILGYVLGGLGALMFLSAVLVPLGVVLLAASYWSFRRAKKHVAILADTLLDQDQRAPVVYLRSFADEQRDNRLGAIVNAGNTNIANSTPAWGPREQDALGAVLSQIGPYIAIGKPDESLPELGAARAYVADDEWQERIRDWVGRARLVVFRAGATQGLRWELSELVRSIDARRLLVILPTHVANYVAFAAWANDVLPQPLPTAAPAERLVIFNPTWRATMLPPRTSLKKTLAPYFEQNGIRLRASFVEDFIEHNGLR